MAPADDSSAIAVTPWRHRLLAPSPVPPEALALSMALLIGVVAVFLSPPFSSPDEQAHFFRAYQISEGHLVADSIDGTGGGVLPCSVLRALLVVGPPPIQRPCWHAMDFPLEPDARCAIRFAGSAVYSPVAYAPQALSMAVLRLAGATPATLMIGGRLANLITGLVALALAIYLAPTLSWALIAMAMTPMVVFQRSSLSADGPAFAVALVFVALCVRTAVDDATRIRWPRVLALALLAAALGLIKPPYAAMSVLVLLVPPHRFSSRWRWAGFGAVVVVSAVAAVLAWSLPMARLFESSTSMRAQLDFVAHHPLHTLAVFALEITSNWASYLRHLVGILGWLDAEIGWTNVVVLALAGLALVVSTELRLGLRQRLVATLVMLATAYGVALLLYLAWSDVGSDHLSGLQGRYFIPITFVLPVVAALGPLPAWVRRLRAPTGLAFIAYSAVVLVAALGRRYYS